MRSVSRKVLHMAAAAVTVVLLAGCTTKLYYPAADTEIGSFGKSKTRLRVAVYDYVDRTDGETIGGHKSVEFTPVLSDIAADVLRKSGYFEEVTRVHKVYSSNTKVPSNVNYIMVGEVKKFAHGGHPHPLTFVNPISLFCVVLPIPSCLVTREGKSEVRSVLLEANTKKIVSEFSVNSKFEENGWGSPWIAFRDSQISGTALAKQFDADLNDKLAQSMSGNLGLMILAKDPSADKGFMTGNMQAGSTSDDILAAVNSDIDELPTKQVKANRKSYAIVIGIEKYRQNLPKADYATQDANLMADYLTKILGYPSENVITLMNDHATKGDFEKYFEQWLPNNVEPGSKVFVYYSGHGAPNPTSGDAYLVPYDADPSFINQTGYSLKKMYDMLGRLRAKNVVVALDSCFSGAGGRSVLAKGARPLVMNIQKSMTPADNMIVLAAASGSQASSTYSDKGHGLFTYFFLKGIKNEDVVLKDGSLDIASLYDYVKPQVAGIARRKFNNEQTPQLIGAVQ